MNPKKIIPHEDTLNKDDLIKLYAIERVASAVENFTSDTKEILTNPLGLGTYLRKLAEKDDPLAYIPALAVVSALIYLISAKYGDEKSGLITVIIFSGRAALILIFRFIENYRRRGKS